MAQELLYHIRLLQDAMGMALTGGNVNYEDVDYAEYPDNTDPLHSDAKLREDILRGVYWVISDIAKQGGWQIKEEYMSVTAGVNEYVIPKNVVAPLALRFFFGNRWTAPVDIIDPDEFHSDYWEEYQGVYPEYATLHVSQGRESHIESTITTANSDDPLVIHDSNQNFATTLSGQEIDRGDYVFNDTGGSYGFVDYLDITTSKVSAAAGTVSGNTVTAAAIGAASPAVAVGDILQLADNSWSLIISISGNDATCSRKVHGDSPTLATAATSFNIGTSNQVVIQDTSFFVDDLVEGLIGGDDNDLDLNDIYNIQARVPTIDILKIRPAFNFTDSEPTRSMKLEFWGLPPKPVKPFHEIGLPDHYEQAVHTKAKEFTMARDTGQSMPYSMTINEVAKQRRIHNVKSGDRYNKMTPPHLGRRQPRYQAYRFTS